MSTRAIIARPHPEHGWAGRYHHWDGYPTGLGRELWHILHDVWGGDVAAMLEVLLDQHGAGWSTILDADWTLEPGFVELPRLDAGEPRRPRCFCHGDRSDPRRQWLTPGMDWGAEWCYVLDADARTMAVLEAVTDEGGHAMGMFGMNPARNSWAARGVWHLDGPEPEWERIG